MSKTGSESSSTCILCLCEKPKALARSCTYAGSSEPSPHADVIRTIISCADQFTVYNVSVIKILLQTNYFILFSMII